MLRKKRIIRRLKGFLAGFILGGLAGSGIMAAVYLVDPVTSAVSGAIEAQNKSVSEESPEAVRSNAEMLSGDSDDWMLALINADHPLDPSYVPALSEIDSEHSVDSRIIGDLTQMMSDGRSQGLDMYVTSAYRSCNRQAELFYEGLQERLGKGMTPLEAFTDTGRSIAYPGTSEHAAGLAVDIVASGYSELDERQADTPEQQWLMAHCHEYGFILRYPAGTESITGITYEPWHYRYVGKTAAAEIAAQGITLEEYLSQ